jgi:DNA-binding NarL/FixJ family response regulator
VAVRVLVVDDHAGFRSVARRLLATAGFDVVGEAASCVEAVSTSERLRPDAVLLDVQLPDADGFELSRRLAQQTDPPAVVLTSARALADYGVKVLPPGVRGFLAKAELSGTALTGVLDRSL